MHNIDVLLRKLNKEYALAKELKQDFIILTRGEVKSCIKILEGMDKEKTDKAEEVQQE